MKIPFISFGVKFIKGRLSLDKITYYFIVKKFRRLDSLIIEKDVMITEGVLISDTIHGYEDVLKPISKQRMFNRGPIRIKEGSWIGNGARIVGSVTIGKNAVVGANAYVDKDVPDFSVVAGVPAKIIKQYNTTLGKWEKV